MPHPTWTPGIKQPMPYTGTYEMFDPTVAPKPDCYAMVVSSFVPRPIALVSSLSTEGHHNVAPFSYFNAVGHNPVNLTIGCNRSPSRQGGKKDTLINIEETGEFVVNIMSDWWVEAANHTCGDYDRGVDEAALSGLTLLPAERVKAPRLAESAVHMECKLRQIVEVPAPDGTPSIAIVIAEVVMFHVHEAVAGRSPQGKLVVNTVPLRPISRLGGTQYATTGTIFDIGRPVMEEAHLGPAQYTASYKAALEKQGKDKDGEQDQQPQKQ